MEEQGAAPPGSEKVFLQRDFSEGMAVKFEKNIPRQLEGKIPREALEETINQINELYAKAEELSCHTVCEGFFACLTSYLLLGCLTSHYNKMAKQVTRYIDEQNDNVYRPKGLLIVDPLQRGLRTLEIIILPSTNAVTL